MISLAGSFGIGVYMTENVNDRGTMDIGVVKIKI